MIFHLRKKGEDSVSRHGEGTLLNAHGMRERTF